MKKKFIFLTIVLLAAIVAYVTISNHIPRALRGVTRDPATAKILANLHPKKTIGSVESKNGRQQFHLENQLLFEAQKIGSRSRAEDGTIALEATTGDLPPIEDAEIVGDGKDVKLIASPREIWWISPSGKKRKLSPESMDAFAPVISPDATKIAFTGRSINLQGMPEAQKLYMVMVQSGAIEMIADNEKSHDFQIWALDWIENGSVLRALQDHGETGGNMKIKKFTLGK